MTKAYPANRRKVPTTRADAELPGQNLGYSDSMPGTDHGKKARALAGECQ